MGGTRPCTRLYTFLAFFSHFPGTLRFLKNNMDIKRCLAFKNRRLNDVLLLLLFLTLGYALLLHRGERKSASIHSLKRQKLRICIIGNAETKWNAFTMHRQWQGQFPSVWYYWGPPSANSPGFRGYDNIHFLESDGDLSWAQGLHYALEQMKKLHNCDYFFTHDDDLKFYSTEDRNLPETLLEILEEYQPAVAGFPYDFLISKRANAARLAQKFKDNRVAPLTGFDSG